MRGAPNLVELSKDGRGEDRFTTREMIETERLLRRAAELMAGKERHEVNDRNREAALARAGARGLVVSGEQAEALAHSTDERGLGVKNGTLGAIVAVSERSMCVRTDGGLNVSFNLKGYDRIGHG